MPDTEPAAPNRASPVRGTDTPSSPAKTTEGQGDDVIITGMGHSSPGHLLRLELALVFPEEEGMMQQSSVSISLSF